ncbi:amidohydrolase family protein [Rhodococcus qingshengii]|uniref:amidohydrolase family protein n=1 Tax=Rhodococcus qingshengii TaxID=334542 RepID=UPI0036DC4EA8
MSAFDGLLPIPPAADVTDDAVHGRGPYQRLILRGATIVDGTGAPPYGPADIVVEEDRIEAIVTRNNATQLAQSPGKWDPRPGDQVIDLHGCYVLPGLVDAHAHIGSSAQVISAEYVYKLWLGHGVTSVRELGSMTNGFEFTQSESRRSEQNRIVAPRIRPYVYFGHWRDQPVSTEVDARAWVHQAHDSGAAGIKFFGAAPDVMRAALLEAKALGMPTACHHAQPDVARVNALTSARWGLRSIEHWYGLPEALFTDQRVQRFPANYNYLDESARFAAAGDLWQQAAPPGSGRWDECLDELVELGTALVPTFNIYIATRDASRVRNADWLADYLSPTLQSFFTPSASAHGSFFSDWGTEQEVSWKQAYGLWMAFVKAFHDRGGLVAAGSDSGFIYKLYGFGFVEELELLREAGLSALEVIRAATLNAATVLGIEDTVGSIEVGKKADLVVLDENPLANLKVLYGHGHLRYSEDGVPFRTGGVRQTIKNGIVYDAEELRSSVRELVARERISVRA